jgi:hypothetical protein
VSRCLGRNDHSLQTRMIEAGARLRVASDETINRINWRSSHRGRRSSRGTAYWIPAGRLSLTHLDAEGFTSQTATSSASGVKYATCTSRTWHCNRCQIHDLVWRFQSNTHVTCVSFAHSTDTEDGDFHARTAGVVVEIGDGHAGNRAWAWRFRALRVSQRGEWSLLLKARVGHPGLESSHFGAFGKLYMYMPLVNWRLYQSRV